MKTTMVHTQPSPEPLGPKKTLIVMVSFFDLIRNKQKNFPLNLNNQNK